MTSPDSHIEPNNVDEEDLNTASPLGKRWCPSTNALRTLVAVVITAPILTLATMTAATILDKPAVQPSPRPDTASASAASVDEASTSLTIYTESTTASFTITYPDGSTQGGDLPTWASLSILTPVEAGTSVSIEVRATSVPADPKHGNVSCAITSEPAGGAAPETYDSKSRHGSGTLTCEWTRES